MAANPVEIVGVPGNKAPQRFRNERLFQRLAYGQPETSGTLVLVEEFISTKKCTFSSTYKGSYYPKKFKCSLSATKLLFSSSSTRFSPGSVEALVV